MIKEYNSVKAREILQKIQQLRTENDIDYLLGFTSGISFFSQIKELNGIGDMQRAICKALTLKSYVENEVVVKIGECNNSFYIILTGEVGFYSPKMNLKKKKHVFERSKTSLESIRELNKIDQQEIETRININFEIDLSSLRESLSEKLNRKSFRGDLQNNEISFYLEKSITYLMSKDLNEEKLVLSNFIENNQNLEKITLDNSNIYLNSTLFHGSFGELGLVSNRPRAYTIITHKPSIFAVLSQKSFKKITSDLIEKKIDEKVEVLRRLTIFSK